MTKLNLSISNARKAITAAFVLGVVVALAVESSTHGSPIVIVCCVSAAVLAWYYVKKIPNQRIVSLLPAAITLEVALLTWAKHDVQTQISVTLGLSAALLFSRYKLYASSDETQYDQQVSWSNALLLVYIKTAWYVYAWIAFRATVVLFEATTAASRFWYASQLLIVLGLLVLIDDSLLKAKEQVQFAVLGMVGFASVLYALPNTVPYGISLVLLVIPICQVLNSITPNPYKVDTFKSKSQPFVALACVAAAMIWQRHLEAGSNDQGVSIRKELGRNLVPAYAGCVLRSQSPEYCCAGATFAHPNPEVTGCVPLVCYDAVKDGTRDCCRQVLTQSNIPTMEGPYLCAYNSTPGIYSSSAGTL